MRRHAETEVEIIGAGLNLNQNRFNAIGLYIAKQVSQTHGTDASVPCVIRKRLVRARLLKFSAAQPPCTVAMQASAGAHR
ncbi:MAG TPA: hypothetical protein VGC15_16410 [Acetobacteraceae bacterium]